MAVTDTLFAAAREAMARCHAPYSKFPVGAAILAEDGVVYKGANIENLAFPQGWCAECTAIGAMVMGGARKIREIGVIAEKLAFCPPCGGCRQKIAEFADAATLIHLYDETGAVKTLTMAELLPFSFATDTIDGAG
jgi:cytidine deaminase